MTVGDSSVSRRAFLRSATAVTTATGATGIAAAQEGQSKTVEMNDDLKFVPADLTIAPGTTVVWENVGSIAHSVTAYEDNIPEGASYFASGGFDAEQAARSAYPDGSIEGGRNLRVYIRHRRDVRLLLHPTRVRRNDGYSFCSARRWS
jgi:plastocyanin